jgi:uroporphyrinogen decarboxylase
MEYGEEYPALGILGGIDKMEIAKGKEAIDALMPKIKELLDAGRYIPSPDHAIPPEVSYENYVYFVKRLRETIGECADLKEK